MSDDDDDNRCYLKKPEGLETWGDVIPAESVFTVELNVNFRGSEIRSSEQLGFKLDRFFGSDVFFKDIKVTRPRAYFLYQVVVDTENLITLVNHDNYGKFEGDYTIEVVSYFLNKTVDGTVEDVLDTPMKMYEGFKVRAGEENELVITMRRGPNSYDAPAKGMQTFRIFSDLSEVTKVLEHFNLGGKVTRVSKATPSIPTLAIALTRPVEEWQDSIFEEPIRVYYPSPQSMDTGSSELWAHLRLDKNQRTKRITIEGIDGRANLDEIRHKLSYHGVIKSELTPTIWTSDDNAVMRNVRNGDLTVTMDLTYELNYLIMGRTAFRVT